MFGNSIYLKLREELRNRLLERPEAPIPLTSRNNPIKPFFSFSFQWAKFCLPLIFCSFVALHITLNQLLSLLTCLHRILQVYIQTTLSTRVCPYKNKLNQGCIFRVFYALLARKLIFVAI